MNKCRLSPVITNRDLLKVSCVRLIQRPPAVDPPALQGGKAADNVLCCKTLGFVMDNNVCMDGLYVCMYVTMYVCMDSRR